MSFTQVMLQRLKAQEPRAAAMQGASIFSQKLEERLDERRKTNRLLMMNVPRDTVDFSSNDFLSVSSSGILKKAFFEELARNPNFQVGQSGSRLMDGNTTYAENLEKDFAKFLGSEACLIYNSGYAANGAIFSVLPQPGDAIVYDELVHASILDGMDISRASIKKPFLHNDISSFTEVLQGLKNVPNLRSGKSCVLVAVESVYSMDGNVAPVEELLRVAKQIFPLGNIEFFFDEAHSTGLMGPLGRGMTSALGLEKQIAVRLHTFGKGLGCNGAIIMCSETVRNMLVNFSRELIFTAGPSFPFLASMRAAYNVLKDGLAEEPRRQLQRNLRHFYTKIFSHPIWKPAKEAGILSIPEGENFETQETLLQIIPIWTRARNNHHLAAHIHLANYKAFPVSYPVVPKGQGRMRLVLHAGNTIMQIDTMVGIICNWATEMYELEKHGKPLDCQWAKLVATAEAMKAKKLQMEDGKNTRALLIEEGRAYKENSLL